MRELIAGFLAHFPDEALQRRFGRPALFVGIDHAGDRLDQPASPVALLARRKPELMDRDDDAPLRIVKERRDGVSALEDKNRPGLAHLAVEALVRDRVFVDLEKSVEQPPWIGDLDPPGLAILCHDIRPRTR